MLPTWTQITGVRFAVAVLALTIGCGAASAQDDAAVRKINATFQCAVLAQSAGATMQPEALRLGNVGMALALEYGKRVHGSDLTQSWVRSANSPRPLPVAETV